MIKSWLGGEAFSDEDGMGCAMAADADGVKIAKDGTRESTEFLWIVNRSFGNTARKNGGRLELSGK